ncbi:MAG: Flp pilus assembly complex ATPase component TadA [Nitrospirae bacterium]|nr:Flp pilus assembly complex ATPase component TadA [Nitrospirota bacterium]
MQLGQLLKEKNLITEDRVQMALAHQKVTGTLLGDLLVKLGFVSSEEIALALAEQAGIPFINLSEYVVSEEVIKLIPKDIAEKIGFIPLRLADNAIEIGITTPANVLAVDTVLKITGKQPRVFMIDSEGFHETLEKSYFFLANPIGQRIATSITELKSAITPPAAVISTLSENLIMEGVHRKATDIHITPTVDTIDVFYRIDGVLQYGFCIPKIAYNGIVTKIKVQSMLDISEQRLPQDGSFSMTFLNKKYEMRVSTIPTIYGENTVIRILAGTGSLLRITNLGFAPEDIQRLSKLFQKPYGIILITGPTGSGKTTTLYAALREINLIERNVITVEDPVEYKLSFIKQTSVNPKTGYDFALAGRNFMRQDPDVILLGEIRDEETAKIAVRASITGHLVLSTLHTNDAVTAIPRLLDFSIDRFLLSSSLFAVVAQRLVRKLCNICKEAYPVSEKELRLFDLFEERDEYKISTAYRAKGCEACNRTGYMGRTVVGEIMIINDELRELITETVSLNKLKDTALRNGMVTLRLNGIKKVIDGITSIEEIRRVIV